VRARTPRAGRLPVTVSLLLALCCAVAAVAHSTTSRVSAGAFAVRVKQVEVAKQWGRLWSMLHPGQRAFIPRSLFVSCLSRQHIVSPKPKTIRAVATSTVLQRIPGVTTKRVGIKAVKLKILYAQAPSQLLTTKVVSLHGSWYWITSAGSKKAFKKTYFCG
jgi:hypothetical protein